MDTGHRIIFGNAQRMEMLASSSVDLIVTSPPYPMIEMWDATFAAMNQEIAKCLPDAPMRAFELMHAELDKVWDECFRVLKSGGFLCINIGEATRTVGNEFRLYNNSSRIVSHCTGLGLVNLPNILWRKQTNAPNKFMGSGMLPCGAYVTLEHEWILIFRKGGKRMYRTDEEKSTRRQSGYFWEERNVWFSDLWDNIKGTKQKISADSRDRSAAYPLEIPYRLINMYSLQGDTVLDPFLGTGTTTLAAIMSNRNSIGYEIDDKFIEIIADNILSSSVAEMNDVIDRRITAHKRFVSERMQSKEIKHYNEYLDMPVMTSQETDMRFVYLSSISGDKHNFTAEYAATAPACMKIKIGNRKQPASVPAGTQIALTF